MEDMAAHGFTHLMLDNNALPRGQFDETPCADALSQRPLEAGGARRRPDPVPGQVPNKKPGTDVCSHQRAKRRRDLGFPVIESQLPGAALQHAVGQVAGKDAAARDARQSSRLLKNAEFVKTPTAKTSRCVLKGTSGGLTTPGLPVGILNL